MFAIQQAKKQTLEGEYIFSVQELNLAARETLESHFQVLWVSGEISNLSHPASGHIYFSLKDAAAQVRCAWFRGRQGPMRFQLENGQQVLVRALVTIYPERGDYQLVVEKVELAGLGLLQQQLEALKRKLQARGLFDLSHKKSLPAFPQTIGVITSETGAALQDVLTVLKRRAPFIKVLVYSCLVQGNEAPPLIIRALRRADREGLCDVLLLTRGGGSLEDLWAFNNEQLAEAIFECQTPIVSAMGHEIDLSISDLVADVRAPTPSAAAELMSPDTPYLYDIFSKKRAHLNFLIKRLLENYSYSVDQIARLLKHPQQQLGEQRLRLQFFYDKLAQLIHRQLVVKSNQLQNLHHAFEKKSPSATIKQMNFSLTQAAQTLEARLKQVVRLKENHFYLQLEKLETLSPMGVLARGYAIAYSENKRVIDSVKKVQVEQKLLLRLLDGNVICQVQDIKP
jgi:exodeoxyribonuclease VII large subunit